MTKAIVLFNGIRFSPAVVDAACNWAKANKGELILLTLKAAQDKQRGYGFPSDLTITENITTDKDAEEADNQIAEGYLKMAGHRCESDNIGYQSKILSDPSFDELANTVKNVDVIFTAENSEKPGALTVESISLGDWLNSVAPRIVYVNAEGKESFFTP